MSIRNIVRIFKTTSVPGYLLAGLLFLTLSLFVFSYGTGFFFKKLTFESYADEIIKKCNSLDKSYVSQRCYDVEIPKLMPRISMEDAFEVIKIIQSKDDTYWACHEAGHDLSAKEYYKDTDNWNEVMTRCPVGMCSTGCLHGTIQEHFSSEALNGVQLDELLPDLSYLCEKRSNWDPTPQQQSSCYHEIGHLSIYITGADLNRSAKICEEMGISTDGRNYLQTCYEGIFMQIFQPREIDDFALIYNFVPEKEKLSDCEQYAGDGFKKGACWKIGWKGNVAGFCGQFKSDFGNACFREAWVIDDEKLVTAQGMTDFCRYAGDSVEERKCYNKIFYGLMDTIEFNETKMIKICIDMPEGIKSHCFADTAARMMETDKQLIERAIKLCDLAEPLYTGDECYNKLIYSGSRIIHAYTEEFNSFCRKFSSQWKLKC